MPDAADAPAVEATAVPSVPLASEAVQGLTKVAIAQIQQLAEQMGGIALRDAKLDPRDGWRYDLASATYQKVGG